MTNTFNVADLTVIGYADPLPPSLMPSVVAPVFSLKASCEVLLAPFILYQDLVVGGVLVSRAELDDLAARDSAVILDCPYDAKPDYELWIDDRGVLRYEERSIAEGAREKIAAKSWDEAVKALEQGNAVKAAAMSSTSFRADDSKVEPLAVMAVAYRAIGDENRDIVVTADGEQMMSKEGFAKLVELYDSHFWRKTVPTLARSAMAGVARVQ